LGNDAPDARSWPALDLRFASVPSTDCRDHLLVLLDDFEPTAVHEPSDTHWRVFFPSAMPRNRAAAAVADRWPAGHIAVSLVEVADEGWAERAQADLRAVRVEGLIVAPPWDVPSREDLERTRSQLVVIRPSMGFGTGHHASTRLCLRALQRLNVTGRSVLDVGTGSGVLAIAARRLGASEVVGLDHDVNALACARENAALNGIRHGLTFREADVRSVAARPADVVLGNLTGTFLIRQSALLLELTRPGGHLILCGFTAHEADRVRAAFSPATVTREDQEEDWVAMLLVVEGAGPESVKRSRRTWSGPAEAGDYDVAVSTQSSARPVTNHSRCTAAPPPRRRRPPRRETSGAPGSSPDTRPVSVDRLPLGPIPPRVQSPA
jgi:ribosomal protein L11 methyltransferase